jgi:hypothetical protein
VKIRSQFTQRQRFFSPTAYKSSSSSSGASEAAFEAFLFIMAVPLPAFEGDDGPNSIAAKSSHARLQALADNIIIHP